MPSTDPSRSKKLRHRSPYHLSEEARVRSRTDEPDELKLERRKFERPSQK